MAFEFFIVTNSRAFPSTHSLLIEPFKTIWETDVTEKKEEAIAIFSYVDLMCTPRKSNPFMGYRESERPAYVKKETWGNNPPRDGSRIIAAVAKYQELLKIASPSYSLLLSARAAAETTEDFLNDIDYGLRTNSGSMLYKPKEITATLKEIPDVKRAIDLLLKRVDQELAEDSKTRNEREIGEYER